METKTNNNIEIFNEFLILLTIINMLIFTDLYTNDSGIQFIGMI